VDIASQFNSKITLLHVYDEGINQWGALYIDANLAVDLERKTLAKMKELLEKQV
jgi:nucleotide-binding universal stress UspA family protein